MATTGADGRLCISSMTTDSILATFQIPNSLPGWSCCFSPIDPNIVYVGSLTRKIFVFDLRLTSGFVKELQVSLEGPPLPVHSLLATQNAIFGASLNGIFRLEPTNDSIVGYSQTTGCFSLAFDGKSLLLGSFRKGSSTECSVYTAESFEEFFKFSLPSPNSRLVSLSLTAVSEDVALVGVIDEPTSAVHLWQVNLKNQDKLLWQRLPINGPVYSLSFLGNSDLLVLTDNSLHYFKASRAL